MFKRRKVGVTCGENASIDSNKNIFMFLTRAEAVLLDTARQNWLKCRNGEGKVEEEMKNITVFYVYQILFLVCPRDCNLSDSTVLLCICPETTLMFYHYNVKQSRYRPGVAQRVPRS
jgi:hypothetical protein